MPQGTADSPRPAATCGRVTWAAGPPCYPPPLLIPCGPPGGTLGAAVDGYLDAGDFTHASRATYRRVLGTLARDLGPTRPATTLTGSELTGWFTATRATYARSTWTRIACPGQSPSTGGRWMTSPGKIRLGSWERRWDWLASMTRSQ